MRNLESRKLTYFIIFILVGIIFLIRLFYLQILDDSYTEYARRNVLQEVTIYPARGLIKDRNGELLVYNDAIYDLMVQPNQVQAMDTLEFCKLLSITIDDFVKKLNKAKAYSMKKSSLFEKQITAKTYASFQEKLYAFPGFFVQIRTDRKYNTNSAAHVLGSIGEADSSRIAASEGYYKPGDFVGQSGIERSYELLLRGRKGVKYVLVDVHNREQGAYKDGIFDTAALPGINIYTTLDKELQAYGEELMQNKIGSVVAIEPATGEILSLVSSPGYDPNLLIGRDRGNNYAKLLLDPIKPLLNRPLSAPYPPGSIFKIIEALVAEEEGVLGPDTRYHCGGGYRVGGHTVKCSHGHPSPLDLRGAIMHSCNPYFCYVFRSIVDQPKFDNFEESYINWYKHMQSFGVGRKLGIDLYGEAKGILYKSTDYDKIYGRYSWKGSTIISLAIGQGELGVTPLQMANIVAIIANRGFYYIPHILKYIGEEKTQIPDFNKKHYASVDSGYYPVVVEGMADVVRTGTARSAQIKGIEVCGKTGTSQNPHGKDHAIFFGFAPKDNPKIAIAVVVENSGFGGVWAAPIASLMMEKYLFKDSTTTRPDLEKRIKEANLIPEKYAKPAPKQ